MKRQLNLGLMGGLGLLAVASAMGCEAQVDDDYTGEPLFSVQGHVEVSGEQADSDLVPHLAFRVAGEEAKPMVLLGGELAGEFPAKFRFDVTQPPPDSTLSRPYPEIGLNGKVAGAYLVMRPRNDKTQILSHIDAETTHEPCADDASACTRVEVGCTDDGRCRERLIECSEHSCDPVEQWGDLPSEVLTTQTTWRCDSEFCYSITSRCNNEGDCGRDVHRCDFAQYGEWVDEVTEGVMTTCNVRSESGDTSLLELADLDTVVHEYFVIYVTEDSPDTVYGALKRGYNLVSMSSNDGWLQSEKCQIDTFETALAEYNEEHGTTHTPASDEPEVEALDDAAWEKCSWLKVVEQPLGADLTLELGGLPRLF